MSGYIGLRLFELEIGIPVIPGLGERSANVAFRCLFLFQLGARRAQMERQTETAMRPIKTAV